MSHISFAAVEDRSRSYAVPSYNPSDYHNSQPIPLDYAAPVAPLSENPLLELRRPINKDACFSVSALSPMFPHRRTVEQDTTGVTLLDRYLHHQAYPYSPARVPTPGTPGHYVPTGAPVATAPMKSPGWMYGHTPITPGNPRSVWSFMNQPQNCATPPPLPGPPPGPPPPASSALARIQRVANMPPPPPPPKPEGPVSRSTTPFRQPARGQAPRPLQDRQLVTVAPKVPLYTPGHGRSISSPVEPPPQPKAIPHFKRLKPKPIDVDLAEGRSRVLKAAPATAKAPSFATRDAIRNGPRSVPADVQRARDEAVARLQGQQRTPSTAVFRAPTPKGNPISPNRGLPLSPINTQVGSSSRNSLEIKFLVSPTILSPAVLSPGLSPRLVNNRSSSGPGRNTRSPSPPVWSPETPRAMSFDYPIIISTDTPPLPNHEWVNGRPQTIIEEDIQDETPLEVAPPRGRISSQLPPVQTAIPRTARARSMSPPNSAYAEDSPFNWDTAAIESRYATDDDFYVAEGDMAEEDLEYEYMPQDRGFNPRQTILASYYRR